VDKKITRLAGIEFSVKAELALLFGLVLTMLLGYPNVSSLPVAAILVFWTNRSLRGSVEYFGVRVRLQFIFALFDWLAVMLFKRFFPSVPDWIGLIILACLVVPVALKCYYRNKAFMPLNITPILSNLIILAGLFSTDKYGYQRVLWTFCGCLLGVVLAFIIPGKKKLLTVKDSLYEISGRALDELWNCVESGKFAVSDEYAQLVMADAATELKSIGAYCATVRKDHSKSTKFPMRLIPLWVFTRKFKKYEKDVPIIESMLAAANSQHELIKYIHGNKQALNGILSEQGGAFARRLAWALELHGQSLAAYVESGDTAESTRPPELIPYDETEIVFMSHILDYEEKAMAFAGKV